MASLRRVEVGLRTLAGLGETVKSGSQVVVVNDLAEETEEEVTGGIIKTEVGQGEVQRWKALTIPTLIHSLTFTYEQVQKSIILNRVMKLQSPEIKKSVKDLRRSVVEILKKCKEREG